MKINPHGQQPQVSSNRSDDSNRVRGEGENSIPVPSDTNLLKGKVPELPQLTLRVLIGNLTSAAGIRESVVNDIKAKVANGEYLTEQSADEAAKAILGL